MRKSFSLLVLLALSSAPAAAQGDPERVRTRVREVLKSVHVERYQRNADREEQTERTTRTVRIGANGQLDVGNVAGNITVTKGSGNEATIEIVKTARGRTQDDAREMLQLVQVDVSERAGRAEVRTRYPSGEERRTSNRRNINVSVTYTITAPAGTQVTAKSISGDISVRDIRGELALESVSGTIQVVNGGRIAAAKSISGNVDLTGADMEGALDVGSVSGTVTLRRIKARHLDAGSISGDVVIEDVQCERIGAQSISGSIRFSGQLSSGGRYELKSHSGDVRLALAGDTGFELDANSFSGDVRTDLPLVIQGRNDGARGHRRAVHGTFGDGSAVLGVTTFSGSIVITKR